MTLLIGLLALGLVAIISAEMLRRLGVSGWRIAGGLVAGILLGPTLLGRVVPDFYESAFLGGVSERERVRAIDEERRAYEFVASAKGAGDVDRREKQLRYEAARAEAERAWRDAMHREQVACREIAILLAAVVLLGGGRRRDVHRPAMGDALSIGLWSAGLPAGMALLAMWSWAYAPSSAATFITVAAAAAGPWRLPPADAESASMIEQGGAKLVETAGRVACVIAGGVASIAIWRSSLGDTDRWLATGACAMPLVGWLVPTGRWNGFVERIAMPALAALTVVRIELFIEGAIWPLAVFVVLSGDGRWLGAYLGARLPGGRHGLRTMSLVLGSMAAGPTQLALAAIGAVTGLIPNSVVLGLAAGAAVVELSEPARRSMARRMEEIEREIESSALDE
jgi:hypothetical protein